MPRNLRKLLLGISGALFLGTVGCANLDDVANLTKLADAAQQTLPVVVADIPASCQRQNLLINGMPSSEKPPSLMAQDCAPYQSVADHLSKDQNVLIAYFDALGKLASNTPFSYDQNIDSNVATIAGLPNISQNAIDAGSGAQKIMKVLADIATRSYRQRKLNSVIENTDDAVQQLTTDLKKVIVQDYGVILDNENNAAESYYQGPIASAGKNERLALIVVQRQYDGDVAALQARKNSAIAYGKVMDDLAALHAKLKSAAVKKASLRELAEQIGPNIANLHDAISQLRAGLK